MEIDDITILICHWCAIRKNSNNDFPYIYTIKVCN